MEIRASWQPETVKLDVKKDGTGYSIPRFSRKQKTRLHRPGIYVFLQRTGEAELIPFYVGQSVSVQGRLKKYLNQKENHHWDDFKKFTERGDDIYWRACIVEAKISGEWQSLERAWTDTTRSALDKMEIALISYMNAQHWILINVSRTKNVDVLSFGTLGESGWTDENIPSWSPRKLHVPKQRN